MVRAHTDQVRAPILDQFGTQVEDELPDNSIRVRTVAGKLNLNPGLITFRPEPAAPWGTTVRVRGAAKEGWVNSGPGSRRRSARPSR